MKLILSILIAFCAYFLTLVAAELYIDELKASGGLVTAKDLVTAKWMPVVIAVLAGVGTLVFLNDKTK